jgi:hypothetical protein
MYKRWTELLNRESIMYDNYWNDSRVRAAARPKWYDSLDERTMMADAIVYNDDGDEEVHEVPYRFEVCPTCDGHGVHVNPGIDCNGLTARDFEEDPDFQDEYLSGRYDVACYGCGGRRVVPVPNESLCDPNVIKKIKQTQEESRRSWLESEYELRGMQ